MAFKRIDSAGQYVVFRNLIGPPRKAYGLKSDDALALILEHCGYATVWKQDRDRLTLNFQQPDGQLAAVRFERRIEFRFELDKDLLLNDGRNGLKGWQALPSDRFSILHGIAEQELRDPSMTGSLG